MGSLKLTQSSLIHTCIMKCLIIFQAEFKSRETMCRVLTQDEEDNLAAWLRDNSFLYDKSSADFKLKEKNRT